MTVRTETDSLGDIDVDDSRYWGAQTQRSLENFDIGQPTYRWGRPMIAALGLVKGAAARTNADLGLLDLAPEVVHHMLTAADEVRTGRLDDQFPLVAFQTGGGTHTNMNANEVIAGRANELAGAGRGGHAPVHPNDHVNRGQSSNDVFPTVVHIAVETQLHDVFYPAVTGLREALAAKAEEFGGVVKVGRTHLQDAVPMFVGAEFGAWAQRVDGALAQVRNAEPGLLELAIGGTAVGTGLNTHPIFGAAVADRLAEVTGRSFRRAPDPYAALSSCDALIRLGVALRALALVLNQVAGDVRWLASGPRAGLGELLLPANEPGSSIMPGKTNPTQAEALQLVCARVVGNDATAAFASAGPQLQLHLGRPVIAYAVLESLSLLADACRSFERNCVRGIRVDRERLAAQVAADLMVATALTPRIGYAATARIVQAAVAGDLTLRDAALATGGLDAATFDHLTDPAALASGGLPGAD